MSQMHICHVDNADLEWILAAHREADFMGRRLRRGRDSDCVEAEIDASATDQATSLLDLGLRRRAFSAEMQHFLPGASMAS